MKRKSLASWSIIMLSVSMVVLTALQVSHITSSYKKSAEIIERAINEAINQTIITLEKQEVAIFVYDKFKAQNNATKNGLPQNKPSVNSTMTSYFDEENIPSNAVRFSDKHSYSIKDEDVDAVEAYYLGQLSDPSSHFNKLAIQLEAEFTSRQIPIEKRFDAETIERVMNRTLTSFGIDMDFEFAIVNDGIFRYLEAGDIKGEAVQTITTNLMAYYTMLEKAKNQEAIAHFASVFEKNAYPKAILFILDNTPKIYDKLMKFIANL